MIIKLLIFIFSFFAYSNIYAFNPLKDIQEGLGGIGEILNEGVKQIEKELNKQQNNQPPNNTNKPVQQNEQGQDTQNNIDEEKRKLQEERKALEAERKKLEAQKKAGEDKKNKAKQKAAEEKRKKIESQKKAEEEKKREEQIRAKEEERKKLEALQKAEEERKQKELEAKQKAEQERIEKDKKFLKNDEELKIADDKFRKTKEGEKLAYEKLSEVKKTKVGYCATHTYEDLFKNIKIDGVEYYQNYTSFIRDRFLIINDRLWNNTEDNNEFSKIIKSSNRIKLMNFANILINEGVNKKKIDPKGQIFSDFLASTPGNDETKYLDISFTFHINQPNDIKMFMINGNRANIIFQKKKGESWTICDNECFTNFSEDQSFWRAHLQKNEKIRNLYNQEPIYSQEDIIVHSILSNYFGSSFGRYDVDYDYVHYQYGAEDLASPSPILKWNKSDWMIHVALANALENEDPKFNECWTKKLAEKGIVPLKVENEKK